MKDQDVKKEFAKVIRNAKITAALFFILFTPSLVLTVKEKTEMFGLPKDTWINASIAGFVIYLGFMFLMWKCPKCGKYPGRGWFRKNCQNCGVELN